VTGRRVPAWLLGGSLLLCLAGVAVSAYLTYEHYSGSTSLACPDTGAVNCVKVTTSSYALLLGAPVALLGLLFFVGLTVLCLPQAWRSEQPWLPRLRALALLGGSVFVLYLVWAELFRLEAICLWCTAVHVDTVLLLGLVLAGEAFVEPAISHDREGSSPVEHR
jgi:uncharacterized membrane protein